MGPFPHQVFVMGLQCTSSGFTPILNASTTTATYLDAWKHATVLPLLKKRSADPTMLGNYRLGSLLVYPAKVLEKLINKQLTNHLNKLHLLDVTQSSDTNPTSHTKNLGIVIDDQLTMTPQVNAVTASCFHTLQMLRKIYKWIHNNSRRTITQSLITSHLDYGNTP